jgi:hypothetical protein
VGLQGASFSLGVGIVELHVYPAVLLQVYSDVNLQENSAEREPICPEKCQNGSLAGEHRSNTIKNRARGNCEFPLNPIAGKRCGNSLCPLFSIFSLISKLNVAGSIPVSRSKQSQLAMSPRNTCSILASVT